MGAVAHQAGARPGAALAAALAKVEASARRSVIRDAKRFARRLLTGEPVHMEVCRRVAMAEDIDRQVELCADIRAGICPPFSRLGGQAELIGTVIALRARRRARSAALRYAQGAA